jgi:hypothetical protein
MLFPVYIHQKQKPVKLHKAFGKGFKDHLFGPFMKKFVKGLFVYPQLCGNIEQEIVFGYLDDIVGPCKGN